MIRRSKSSQQWLSRQRRDPFARRAAAEGHLSRARFKLEELDRRFRLVAPGMAVLELGGAPGGWTRYLEEHLDGGLLVVIDPRPIKAAAGTLVVEAAYGDAEADRQLAEVLGEARVDLVLSDMAPNMSGNRTTDQARSIYLAELALDAARHWLKPGGELAVKLFQGEGMDAWLAEARESFAKVRLTKPDASRSNSREVYAVAHDHRP